MQFFPRDESVPSTALMLIAAIDHSGGASIGGAGKVPQDAFAAIEQIGGGRLRRLCFDKQVAGRTLDNEIGLRPVLVAVEGQPIGFATVGAVFGDL